MSAIDNTSYRTKTDLVLGVLNSILADKLELDELQKLLCIRNTIKDRAKVDESSIMVDAG